MLTKHQNDLLTQTGPGTPGGELLRRYWQPMALASELPPGGAPLPLRIFSEDLVLFRNEKNEVGLLGIHCSHRGADLSYGRLEDGGLRCIYHGWLYDVHGRCLEQPGEPAGSTFHEKIKHVAYPCHEAAGVIFAYLGAGEPPLFPAYELFQVPNDHVWIYKYYHECNYLQGLEGNLDPSHPFFLHRFLPGGSLRETRVPISAERVTPAFDIEVTPPIVYAEDAEFGVRIYGLYDEHRGDLTVRSSSFIMPNTCGVGGGPVPPGDGYLMSWHVPIDDTHHWRYYTAFKRSGPIQDAHAKERASVTTPDFKFVRNLSNRYLQDREEQRCETYAGMGPIFVAHDNYATETAGAIQDRTEEYLGSADAGLVLERRMLLDAIERVQRGEDPPNVIRKPSDNRFLEMGVYEDHVPLDVDWPEYLERRVAQRTSRA
ncbi:MAG TPA: Rieske 2Fe-2S domain-containing protein [Chloroflexota bacterium]|jgi:phenylpropionate dioxygenase-like ring-hydroxylating dioxygenase large terminal subunit